MLYAFPYKADVKSLVWYVPENFEDAGYEIPETYEDLKALTEQVAADGEAPWCIGLGSGGATGWPATDWVEDLMLRTSTPEDYDAWTTNAMPFNDPKVVAAIDEFGWFAKNPGFRRGRRRIGQRDRFPRKPRRPVRQPARLLPAPSSQLHHDLLPGGHGRGRGCRLLLHARARIG